MDVTTVQIFLAFNQNLNFKFFWGKEEVIDNQYFSSVIVKNYRIPLLFFKSPFLFYIIFYFLVLK